MKKATVINHFRGHWQDFYQPLIQGQLKPLQNGEMQGLCPLHQDSKPSLSINFESGLFNCFGCGAKGDGFTFWAALNGLSIKDDFPEIVRQILKHFNLENGRETGKGKIVAVYDYREESGKLIFQVCRTQPKGFFQQKPDGRGGWINNMRGIQRVLYNLPAVLAAEEIVVTEGEKDCNSLMTLGFTATCNPGGAGKWQKSFSESLRGKSVFLCGDNDDPGRKHMNQVGAALQGIAASVKILELPGLAEKEDISDWIARQPDREAAAERLSIMLENADSWEPPEEPAVSGNVEKTRSDFPLTDLGNAERLVSLHGQDIRFCYPWGKWLVWAGDRWSLDEGGELERRAKETVRQIYAEATEVENSEQREKIATHAMKSESHFRLQAMATCARSELGIPVMPGDLDQDKYLLNVLNGTLDLKSGRSCSHSRDHLITKLAPVKYDPGAECPSWIAFLERIMDHNSDLIDFLRRIVGYSLTGDTTEQCFFLLYGTGENGKSTFLETIRSLLGDYSQQADFSTFLTKRFDTGSNDLAALKGARFVSACEANAGRSLNESLIKQLTGGEAIRSRFLYGEFFEYYPTFKLFLATNHRPRIKNQDNAIWRRVKLIPFAVTIPKAEQDPRLLLKLEAEAPGILNWALQGCREWLDHGLAEPEEVAVATAEYRAAEDILGAFIEDKCIFNPTARANKSELKKSYKTWCEINGEEPVNHIMFASLLESRGCKSIKDWQGRFWKGIELKP